MKCRSCGTQWSLECSVGPGGDSSPGVFLFIGLGLSLAGGLVLMIVLKFPNSSVAPYLIALIVTCWLCAPFVLLKSLLDCGYPKPATGYQGSICPKCNKKNWIWPWNL